MVFFFLFRFFVEDGNARSDVGHDYVAEGGWKTKQRYENGHHALNHLPVFVTHSRVNPPENVPYHPQG